MKWNEGKHSRATSGQPALSTHRRVERKKAEKTLTNGQHMRRCVPHIQDIRPCVEKGRFPFRFQQDTTKEEKMKATRR